MGGTRRLREDVEAPADGEVRSVLPGRQHGVDVGAHQGAHDAAGHLRGRFPEFRGCCSQRGFGKWAWRFRLGTAVKSIKRDQAKVCGRRVEQPKSFDKVLVTTSPNLMAKMCPDLPDEYLKGLLELKSMGAVVMVLSLTHKLSEQGYYWFNLPKEAGFPFLALVEHTNFVPPENFGGDHILYAGDYLEAGTRVFLAQRNAIAGSVSCPPSKRSIPPLQREWVKKVWLFKTNYAQPVPLLNHSKNIPAIRNARGRVVLCLDEPGLPVGSRHELRGGDRAARRRR